MKKFYMTMAAMLFSFAAMAQGVEANIVVSPSPITFTADGKTVTYVEFSLVTAANDAFTSAGIVFEVPEGIKVNQVYDDEEEDYVTDITYPIATAKHTKMISPSSANPNRYTVAIASSSADMATLRTTTNVLVKIGFYAEESMADGDYQLTFGQCSNGSGTTTLARYTPDPVAITVASGTGINSINAADSKAPIFNLAGQRVSKAQQGVFIQNGKKIATK